MICLNQTIQFLTHAENGQGFAVNRARRGSPNLTEHYKGSAKHYKTRKLFFPSRKELCLSGKLFFPIHKELLLVQIELFPTRKELWLVQTELFLVLKELFLSGKLLFPTRKELLPVQMELFPVCKELLLAQTELFLSKTEISMPFCRFFNQNISIFMVSI